MILNLTLITIITFLIALVFVTYFMAKSYYLDKNRNERSEERKLVGKILIELSHQIENQEDVSSKEFFLSNTLDELGRQFSAGKPYPNILKIIKNYI